MTFLVSFRQMAIQKFQITTKSNFINKIYFSVLKPRRMPRKWKIDFDKNRVLVYLEGKIIKNFVVGRGLFCQKIQNCPLSFNSFTNSPSISNAQTPFLSDITTLPSNKSVTIEGPSRSFEIVWRFSPSKLKNSTVCLLASTTMTSSWVRSTPTGNWKSPKLFSEFILWCFTIFDFDSCHVKEAG